jgi:putative SOS response-associated peptidase YedK
MCGRFVAATPADELAKYFDAMVSEQLVEYEDEPNYNTAPTNDIYGIVETPRGRELQVFRWGLIPVWAKDMKIGSKMINARAETLTTKNAFKPAFQRRRMLVPMDGFYEWQKRSGSKTKQPMFIHRLDGEPLAIAGLWESWRDPAQSDPNVRLHSATIITVAANETMAPIHDRMPAVLAPSAWNDWLDPDNRDMESIGALLVPAPKGLLTVEPVSIAVNNVRNNGAELIEPVDPEAEPAPDSGAGSVADPGTTNSA